jgi:hypothetical protein
MDTAKLKDTAIHIPFSPRRVLDRSHEAGTLMSHCDSKEKIIVIIVWPAPLMTPFDMNMTAKKR